MHAFPRAAVVSRDITSGIRIVAPDRVAQFRQDLLDAAGDAWGTGGAVGIAEYMSAPRLGPAPGPVCAGIEWQSRSRHAPNKARVPPISAARVS